MGSAGEQSAAELAFSLQAQLCVISSGSAAKGRWDPGHQWVLELSNFANAQLG